MTRESFFAITPVVPGRLHRNVACGECGFDLWIPVSALASSHIGLYSDDRFPGRCIVSFNEHFDAIDDMPGDTLRDFMSDVRLAALAIRRATGSERVNIAILGNAASHVHAHLIPRHPDREAYPNKAPWEDPRPRKKLVPTDETWWRERIAETLDVVRRRAATSDVKASADTSRRSSGALHTDEVEPLVLF